MANSGFDSSITSTHLTFSCQKFTSEQQSSIMLLALSFLWNAQLLIFFNLLRFFVTPIFASEFCECALPSQAFFLNTPLANCDSLKDFSNFLGKTQHKHFRLVYLNGHRNFKQRCLFKNLNAASDLLVITPESAEEIQKNLPQAKIFQVVSSDLPPESVARLLHFVANVILKNELLPSLEALKVLWQNGFYDGDCVLVKSVNILFLDDFALIRRYSSVSEYDCVSCA